MIVGMAEVIAAHAGSCEWNADITELHAYCSCGWRAPSSGEYTHAAHVAEELAKAGYGSRHEAKAEGLAEAAAIVHARIRDREQPFTIVVNGVSASSGEGAMWAIPDLQLVERVIRARLDALVGRGIGS